MPEFFPEESISTEDAKVEVTINPDKPLKVGRYVFQLVVVDDSGNESLPAQQEVIVLDTERPTAVLDIRPSKVAVGESFVLYGDQSTDLGGGRINKYVWTFLGQ